MSAGTLHQNEHHSKLTWNEFSEQGNKAEREVVICPAATPARQYIFSITPLANMKNRSDQPCLFIFGWSKISEVLCCLSSHCRIEMTKGNIVPPPPSFSFLWSLLKSLKFNETSIWISALVAVFLLCLYLYCVYVYNKLLYNILVIEVLNGKNSIVVV